MSCPILKMMPFASVFDWLRRDALKINLSRLCAAFLVLLAAVVYVPYIANPLIFDDFNVINDTTFFDFVTDFKIAPRWLSYATLAHTYALTSNSISAMRWGNLIVHGANVVAVFVLMREIFLSTVADGTVKRVRERQALVFASLSAAVLAIHPLAVYGVGYLIQRTILLSTLFTLLMLIAYLRWLITGRSVQWVWSAVWYLLAVFSKEHSVTAPAVALLLTLLIHPPSLSLVRRLVPPFAVYVVIAALVTSMVKGVLGTAYEPQALEMINDMQGLQNEWLQASYTLSLITQAFLFFKYLFLWVFPVVSWMSIDMRVPLAPSLQAWPYWVAATAFLVYPVCAAGMVLRGGGVGVVGWALVFPWLMFLTELSTVRVQEPFVLYRTYLWFPVLGAAIALALCRLNMKATLVIGLALVCIFVPLSWNRLHTMSDTLLLWEDAAKLLVSGEEPGAGRIYYNRATALSAKGRNEEALADMDHVISLHSKLAPILHARGRMLFGLRRYADAERDMTGAIKLDPNRASFYADRGMTLMRLGRNDEALGDFQKSCEMKHVIGCYVVQQIGTIGLAKPK